MAARRMSLRQADAVLAERYLHWRWVAGNGPAGCGWSESDWLLPEGRHLADVRSHEWEMLDDQRQGHFTLKSLPRFTEDIAAAWMLAELVDQVELVKAEGRWRCRIGEVEAVADTAPLAIGRAAFKVGT